jgi:hypothetical protein
MLKFRLPEGRFSVNVCGTCDLIICCVRVFIIQTRSKQRISRRPRRFSPMPCPARLNLHRIAHPRAQEPASAMESKLGRDNPLTAMIFNTVAYCLECLERWNEALPIREKILAISESLYGLDDARTRDARQQLEAVRSHPTP